MTRRNVLEHHTDHCSRHQRQLFSRSGRTRLSYNIVRWQRAKTAKHKILISASNFVHCFHVLTVYWACSICMNPRAGPECKNCCYGSDTTHELWILFVARSLYSRMALSNITCLLCSVKSYQDPHRRHSGPRMDVHAMVGGSFPSMLEHGVSRNWTVEYRNSLVVHSKHIFLCRKRPWKYFIHEYKCTDEIHWCVGMAPGYTLEVSPITAEDISLYM